MAPATLVMVRHGDTAWTLSGQHTSGTDIPLSDAGRRQATELRGALGRREFTAVLTSPLRRARETCELAGFGAGATECDDLVEWDYGEYEGRTTADIRSEVPDWSLWRDGAPGGETAAQVAARADRILQMVETAAGDVLVFSHGHFLRVLAARWLGLDATDGRLLFLSPASISMLGWEREQPVIMLWNQVTAVPG